MKKKAFKFLVLILILVNVIFAVEILMLQLKWTKEFIDTCGTIAIILIGVILLGLYMVFCAMRGNRRK